MGAGEAEHEKGAMSLAGADCQLGVLHSAAWHFPGTSLAFLALKKYVVAQGRRRGTSETLLPSRGQCEA